MGRCPRCKQAVTIPRAAPPPASESADDELTLITPPEPRDQTLFDLPDEKELAEKEEERRRQERILLTKLGVQPQPEHTGERRFAWPLDILLYPTSAPALIVIGLLIGATFLVALIQHIAPALARAGLVFSLARAVMGLYAGWYLVECIYDSAKGGTRAPDFAMVSLREMWSRVSSLLIVCIVYQMPLMLYKIMIDGFEVTGTQWQIIFWVLAAWALIFMPIGILRMVVDDSISAVNPLGLLASIFRVFPQYMFLLLVVAAAAALIWLAGPDAEQRQTLRPLPIEMVGLLIATYGAFVAGHVLGRFYWRNRERLDWGL